MIVPEPANGRSRPSHLGRLLGQSLAASALIFALLEIWRPCFFLTDDNLDCGLPVFTEMGRHLLHGQSPFISDYLFGGHYDLLRDAMFFNWHPVYLVSSLLAGTPFHFWIIDADAFVFMMLSTAGFTTLAWYLRREMPLQLSDGWIVFYSLSFTYSVFTLVTGASWLSFMVNQGALPWLTLGILQKNWRRGVGVVALFSLHEFWGGHPLATISNTIFLALFALGVSFCRRSILPVVFFAAGSALAVVLLLPFLIPMLEGFSATLRAQGVSLGDMQQNNIPAPLFPASLLIGMAIWIVQPPAQGHVAYSLAFSACAAAWCVIPALASRERWRGLEIISLGLLLFGVLMVTRPVWITEIMAHLPVLKSMRWPFRELLQFLFFFHLFLVVRPPGWSPRTRRVTALFSTGILVVPMFLYIQPPTLNAMQLDRNLLFSGDFDRYWDHVRLLLKPTDRVAVLIPTNLYREDRYEKPNCLFAASNYAILARVINASGYSHTVPRDQLYLQTVPLFPDGTFEVSQKAALLQERPDLKFITLESVHPLRITLSSGDGPTMDLTPYAPAQVNGK